jgi:hypothetical protein
MADDTKHAPRHDKFISLEDEYQIDYWTGKFSVTRDQLAKAIGRVGRSAEALEKYLKRCSRPLAPGATAAPRATPKSPARSGRNCRS